MDAVELAHLSVKQCEAHEDKEDMSAEHLQRRLAQRDERLDQHQPGERSAQPVNDAGKSDQVQHAKGTDLPFIELPSQYLLGQFASEPVMTHAQKEEADGCADGI